MEQAQASGKNSIARSTAQVEAPVDVATPASDTADKRTALLASPDAPVMNAPPSDEEFPSRYGLLKSVWQARGFFGGILAIQIAYYGQRALMDRDDYAFSTFCYGLAILVLILSLLHPNLPGRRAATPTAQAAVVDPPGAAAPVDLAASNGHTPGAASPAAPSEAPAGSAIPAALPMRKAGSLSASPAATQDSSVEALGSGTALATPRLEPDVPGVPTEPLGTRKAQPNNGSSPETTTSMIAESTVARTAWQRIPEAVARLAAWRVREGWRVTVPAVLVAVGLLVWSFFALRANIVEPVGGWLWAGGLVALWVALLGVPGWPRGKSLLPGPREDFFGRGVPSLDARWSVLLVGLVLVAAVALRLYNLEYHPGIFGDEGERGSDARDILQGNHILIFGVGWWGVPNLYFYLTSFFLGLLGDHNMVAARMFSVISGVVAVWYVYRTGRLLWGPRVGLIAAALLAASPLALQFSRLAGESTPTGALWAVGFYYMVLALRDRKWTDWLLSGLAWGFSLYFYAAGKMVVPLAAALGLYCLVRWRLDFFKRYALGFALLGATIVVTAMPYLIYSVETNFIYTMSRAEETSIFTPSNQAVTFLRFNLPYDPALAKGSTLQSLVQHPVEWARLLYEQARETLDVLYRRADQVFFYLITDHGGSMFPAFWATIVMLGIAYATWKLWDSRYALVLIWFWFGLLGSILTVDTPNLQRVTGAWPALMLLPAALLDRIFAAGWPLSLSVARRWATIPLAAAVLFFGYTSVQEYFGHYAATCPYCDSTAQARYAAALGQDYKAYQLGLGGYPYYFGHGSTRYLAKDVEGVDLMAAADGLPVVDSNGKGLAFIVYYNNIEYLPLLKLYYPGGTEESISSADGVERFRSYKVTREQLATFQVATATYRPPTGVPVTRDEPGLGTQRAQFIARQVEGQHLVRPQPMEPWTPPAGATYPLQATWEGGLVAPNYGRYLFATNGTAADVRLFVDGMEVIGEGAEPGAPVEIVLAKGVHEVMLSGRLADTDTSLGLSWSGEGGENRPVETRFLYKGPRGGLTAEVGPLAQPEAEALRLPDPFNGQQVRQRRVDPFIGFRETYNLFGSSPYLARWHGTLKADTAGVYGFAATSPERVVLLIDDGIVIDGGDGRPSGSVQLAAGTHTIEMRYASPGGGARVELFWNSPDGQAGLLPPTALVPAKRAWFESELLELQAPGTPVQPPQEADPPPTTMRTPRAVLGTQAGLKGPRGLAVDAAGNVYVGDNGSRRVVVFAPDGKVLSTWGRPLPETYKPEQGEAADGAFGEIFDMAVGVGADGQTYVYVLDSTTRIQVFATDGRQVGTYPAKQLDMFGPNGLAIGPSGGEAGHKLYVSVTGENRLAVYPSIDDLERMEPRPPLGEIVRNIGVQGGVALEQPVDVLADPTQPDVVYSIDLYDRLLRIKLRPDSVGVPGNPTALPSVANRQWQLVVGRDSGGSRLAISPDGRHVYMSDPERNRVAVLNLESGALSYFGTIGRGEGEFLSPSGMAVGPDGLVYVLERLNNRIQVFDADE